MKTLFLIFICLISALTHGQDSLASYKDTIWGQEIEDKYRWLENDNSPKTQKWLEAQRDIARIYDRSIPWKYYTDIENGSAYWGAPWRSGSKFFEFSRWSSGSTPETKVYVGTAIREMPSLLFKSQSVSDFRDVTIYNLVVSYDQQHVGVVFRPADSLIYEASIVRMDGKILKDRLANISNSQIAWYQSGFYYTACTRSIAGQDYKLNADYDQKVLYHRLGTDQASDSLVFFRKNSPDDIVRAYTSYNEKYLVVKSYNKESQSDNIYYKKLENGHSYSFLPAPKSSESKIIPIDVYDGVIYSIVRSEGYDNGRIEKFNTAVPDNGWEVAVPALSDSRVMDAHILRDKIVVKYLQEKRYVIATYDYKGKLLYLLEMPPSSYCSDLNTYHFDTIVYLRSWSMTTPPVLYSYDINTNNLKPIYEANVNYEIKKYTTEQITCTSPDGSAIPLTIIYDKKTKQNSNSPLILDIGDGLGAVPDIDYNLFLMTYLDKGGVYVNANIRGGQKAGVDWHKAGEGANKTKELEDLRATIEFLKAKKYSDDSKMLLLARNDGALIAADYINIKPASVKAAILIDAPFDLIHSEKWVKSKTLIKEYGSIKDSADFKRMYMLSPFHHIRSDVRYPALYIGATTTDLFPSVHARKYVARMQEHSGQKNTCLLNINQEGYENIYTWYYAFPDRYKNYWRFIFNQLDIKN